MTLVVISADDIGEYRGTAVPAAARLYASDDFRASDGTYVAKGSDTNDGFYQQFAASMNGANIRIAGGSAYSTTDALDYTDRTYTLAIYDAEGRKIKTVASNLRIPPASPTTWAQIQIYSKAVPLKYAPTFLDSASIAAYFSTLSNTSAKASEVLRGSSRLSVPAADVNDPIAVGSNDPRVAASSAANKGITMLDTAPANAAQPIAVGVNSPLVTTLAGTGAAGRVKVDTTPIDPANPIAVGANNPIFLDIAQTKHLGSYASLAAAIAAIGSTPTRLKVSAPTAVTTSTVIPGTILLEIDGNGSFNISSGATLTIGRADSLPYKQIFTGAGTAQFAANAVSDFNLAWWVGTVSGSTVTPAMWTGITASLSASNGGRLRIPKGTWNTAGNIAVPSGTIIEGNSTFPDQVGSLLRLTANNAAIFTIGNNARNIQFDNVNFDCNTATGASGVKLVGTAPYTLVGVSFRNCNFFAGEVGLDVASTDTFWEVLNVAVTECIFVAQTVANVRWNTVNGSLTITSSSLTPGFSALGAGADAVRLIYSGIVKITGCTINGVNIPNTGVHPTFVDADVNVTTNQVAKTAHGLPTGATARLQTTGVLPAGLTLNQKVYIRAVNANTLSFHTTYAGAIAGTGIIDITAASGGGTHSIRSNVPVLAGRPFSFVHILNGGAEVELANNQMEGMPYFLYVEGGNDAAQPVTLLNNLTQGMVQMVSTRTVVSIGNNYFVEAFGDAPGSDARIYSYGDSVWNSHKDAYDTVIPEPYSLSNFTGSSVIRAEHRADVGNISRDFSKTLIGSFYTYEPARPVMELGSVTDERPFLRGGRLDADATGISEFYYDFTRVTTDPLTLGFLKIMGNQIGYRGVQVIGPIKSDGLCGPVNFETVTVVTPGASPTLDLSRGNVFTLAPGEDETISATGMLAGQTVILKVTASTTSRTLTFGAGIKTDAGTLATGTVAGKVFIVQFWSDGTTLHEMRRTGAM